MPSQTPSRPVAPPGPAQIGGRVWHDLCAIAGGEGGVPAVPSAGCVPRPDGGFGANGRLEAGEPGIAGVQVSLGRGSCPSPALATARTAGDGSYVFSHLEAGAYCVSVDATAAPNAVLLPGGWTYPASAEAGATARTAVVVAAGETKADADFGWDYQFLPSPR